MTYIHPHNDTKILKLGIRMALYREKNPNKTDFWGKNEAVQFDDYDYDLAKVKYKESRIAYLKEPEFKVGEKCYDSEGNMYVWRREDKQDDDFSHYYPGQEYDGDIKYVREVEDIENVSVGDKVFYTEDSDHVGYPSCKYTSGIILGEDSACSGIWMMDNGDDISMDWVEWQEVKKPISRIGQNKYKKAYTQFQADKEQAKILAIITKQAEI